MKRVAIVTSDLAPAVGPFSAAVRAGDLMYASGVVAQDPATGRLIEGDVAAQTERVLRNLELLLNASGKTFDNVLKVSVFLTDMAEFAEMNSVYGRYFAAP